MVKTISVSEKLTEAPFHVVTGGFGYSGKHITRELLKRGCRVRTLTNSLHRGNPFGNKIEVHPIDFNDAKALTDSLTGAVALHNTYWVRYSVSKGTVRFGYRLAVENSRILFDCARRACVGRIVHLSVTNPDKAPGWPYFVGKVEVERSLKRSGVPYSIVRPSLIYGGPEDVLINNLAWSIRHLPAFGLFGIGRYRLSPIHVDDLARVCADEAKKTDNRIIDAIGPETFEYRDMVKLIATKMKKWRPIVPMPDFLCLLAGKLLGLFLQDIVLTAHEIRGLKDELMHVDCKPLGRIRLSQWLDEAVPTLGKTYTNDLKRRLGSNVNFLSENINLKK